MIYACKEMILYAQSFLWLRYSQLFAGMDLQALLGPQSRFSMHQSLLDKVSFLVSAHFISFQLDFRELTSLNETFLSLGHRFKLNERRER